MISLPILAEIPVLDWRGPQFLLFYAVAFAVAWGWSRLRIARAAARFEVPGPPQPLSDPYEIAYLADGPARVRDLAVMRLVQLGQAEFMPGTGLLKQPPNPPPVPANLDSPERILLGAVQASGTGWSIHQARGLLLTECQRIEMRLAAKGLRPTPADLQRAGKHARLPMAGVIALGAVKLALGLARDRPVMFLLVALGASVILYVRMGSRLAKPGPTPAGKAAVERLQAEHSARDFSRSGALSPTWLLGAALFGSAALAGASQFDSLSRWMDTHREPPAPVGSGGGDSSSGSGCSSDSSSSCSSGGSSCGGGGCGGCGGGGD